MDERARVLEKIFDADAVAYSGPLLSGVDDALRGVVESMAAASSRRRLYVLLTTAGGYIEPVQRIVETFRHHYRYVAFVIPNHAFSAGTVLAMSGNAIYMDYYSRLGPIDPQVESNTGTQVPALGYLNRYERLLDQARGDSITPAEIAILLNFDQAELYSFEQARELSITLLEEWLAKHKFRDWKKTEGQGTKVTKKMRTERAAEIAKQLNDSDRWHSHGYGISMQVLTRDLKLKIDDFGADTELSAAVRGYDDLLQDYLSKRGIDMAIHAEGTLVPIHFHHH